MIRVNRQMAYVFCMIGLVWFFTLINILFSAGSYQKGRTIFESNASYPKLKLMDFNYKLDLLLKKLENPGKRPNYNWIRDRVKQMWPAWVKSGKSFQTKNNMMTPQKKILVHMGLLTHKSGLKIAEDSLQGGPLGELVQWSDIICTLYILGHDITITSEYDQLPQITSTRTTTKQQHQFGGAVPIDMIFSDIVGLNQLKRKTKNGYGKLRCILRVVDSFGTEPAYNYHPYAMAHRINTTWGMQNIDPRQFYTMFPHSPDNSFMGFVINNHFNSTQSSHLERKNQGVVYGKAKYMWLGTESYLEVIRQFVSIHATVYTTKRQQSVKYVVPKYVTNHGILPGAKLHNLLHQSKLFIGLGFPYEGPAPLEAIAQGCVFINPRFSPPHSSKNTKFFKGKPTSRKVTSQNPYAEVYIGPPHVQTVDINDTNALYKDIQQAISDIDAGKVNSFIPYEFTPEGMLQRVNAYIHHQDFCAGSMQWPEKTEVITVLARLGKACSDACWAEGRMCEPSYFSTINNADVLNTHLTKTNKSCSLLTTHEDIYYPAYRPASQECVLQAQPMLYSCVGESLDFIRLCPCRTYNKQQIALCKGCV